MSGIRPLSFTRNIGGLDKVYDAIRKGYSAGTTVEEFRRRCGLNESLSLVVTEFFLCTIVRNNQEYILEDVLINQSLARTSFDKTLARLYFFALNLNMPGERLKDEHRNPAALQNLIIREHAYKDTGWGKAKLDKASELEPFVKREGEFKTAARKWVTNYWFMLQQCLFVPRPDGQIETFPDTWGLLGLRLFFERYTALKPNESADSLVETACKYELHKLMGVPKSWLDARVEGAADMFLAEEFYAFEPIEESLEERKAAKAGVELPPPGTSAKRREAKIGQLIRRGDNRKFIKNLYLGECQVSSVILRLPGGGFTIDCAHIRPLGMPHNGPDDVNNMLSLSPTIHRLFDRGCIRIDPSNFSIKLLHGNDIPHLPKLLVKPEHPLLRDHLSYYNDNFLS